MTLQMHTKGPLTLERGWLMGTGNAIHGYFVAVNANGLGERIDRIDYRMILQRISQR